MSLVIMHAVIPMTPEKYLYRAAFFSTSPLKVEGCLALHSWSGTPGGNQTFSSISFSDGRSSFRRRLWLGAALKHLLRSKSVCALQCLFSNCLRPSLHYSSLNYMEACWTPAHISDLCEIGSTVIKNPENILNITRFWQLYFTWTKFSWAQNCSKWIWT